MSITLHNGLYSAISYDDFFDLILPSNGNVFIEIASNSGSSAIYDEDFNFVRSIARGPMFLEAGTYIVHADYSSPTYGVLNFLASQFLSKDELTSLELGSYSAETYDHFYTLDLPQDGNVFIEIASNSGSSAIYDEDFNFVRSIARGPMFLEAGTYIVHADYSSPTYGVLNFLASQFLSEDELTSLEPGSYSAETYDHFYTLDLPQDGNVFIEIARNSGSSAIYDEDFNFVRSIARGPMFLEAGTYIVHADYSSPTYGVLNFNVALVPPEDMEIEGTNSTDTLEGGLGNDILIGFFGPDLLFGGEGMDTLRGGIGRDSLDGGAGTDLLEGGYGNDRYYVDDAGDRIIERPDSGYDRVYSSMSFHLNEKSNNVEELILTGNTDIDGSGNFQANKLYGNDGRNSLAGGIGDDSLYGGMKADTLSGGQGDDLLVGGLGADVLNGGQGADILRGSRGNDTLRGGRGDDQLTGGQGTDVFVLETNGGHDVIIDFSLYEDFVAMEGNATIDQIAITASNGGAIVSWEDGSLILLGVNSDLLTSDHFQFI